jgi:acetyl-CoA synthetase
MVIPQFVHKSITNEHAAPNMRDYERERATFTWESAANALDGLPGGHGLNIAHEAVDRHVRSNGYHHLAVVWIGRDGRRREYTYRELRELTNQFANVLRALELRPGARVFVLTGRIPELYVSVLGALKNKNIVCTLFSAFGPEPIHTRLEIG